VKAYNTVVEIGRGGFGVVEKVADADGNLFARKTFAPAQYMPEVEMNKLRERFKREVRIQAELGGEEILPVLHHDLSGDNPWFLMPLADKTYEEQIRDDRSRGTVDIDAIADILNGLEVLHDLGYVHRDLNPKNVLYVDGHWKLADLGAVLPPSGVTVTLTEVTVIFTELYCAPEQRFDFHSARAPADVYSFGCILHDIYGNPPRVPYGKHSCAGPVGILIEKCTERSPSRRPTIKKLRGMLLETLVEVGGEWKIPRKSKHLRDSSINWIPPSASLGMNGLTWGLSLPLS
jgi:serine/threonine protein kinase